MVQARHPQAGPPASSTPRFCEVETASGSGQGPEILSPQPIRRLKRSIVEFPAESRSPIGGFSSGRKAAEIKGSDPLHRWTCRSVGRKPPNFLIHCHSCSLHWLERQGQLVAGCDLNPNTEELFHAPNQGKGAFMK